MALELHKYVDYDFILGCIEFFSFKYLHTYMHAEACWRFSRFPRSLQAHFLTTSPTLSLSLSFFLLKTLASLASSYWRVYLHVVVACLFWLLLPFYWCACQCLIYYVCSTVTRSQVCVCVPLCIHSLLSKAHVSFVDITCRKFIGSLNIFPAT